jgi:hypothetical protein
MRGDIQPVPKCTLGYRQTELKKCLAGQTCSAFATIDSSPANKYPHRGSLRKMRRAKPRLGGKGRVVKFACKQCGHKQETL